MNEEDFSAWLSEIELASAPAALKGIMRELRLKQETSYVLLGTGMSRTQLRVLYEDYGRLILKAKERWEHMTLVQELTVNWKLTF